MKNLLPGLRKFSEEVFPHHKPLFESLAQGQKPHTLLITCSDSRIDPSLVTQTQPGELFVVRNAGNIVPPFGSSRGGEEAAIEFAIEGLKVSNVVICGHTQCGAMAGLVGKADLESLPSVKAWLEHAAATKRRLGARLDSASLVDVVEENVLVQADNLKSHPAVSAALRDGRIRVYGWVYHFASGTITIFDGKAGKFVPSLEVRWGVLDEPRRFTL